MGGDVDGIYKTDDLGEHWHLVNTGISGYGIYGLAVSMKNPETVYADATTGLSRSTDGAAHWQPLLEAAKLGIKGKRGVTIRPVAVDPTSDKTVYAGTAEGKVCQSLDGGDSWAEVYSTSGPIHSMSISPDGKIVLAATDKSGLVMSVDGGKAWTPLSTPKKASGAAFATSDPNTIYGAFFEDGIYKSTDKGKTWQALSAKGRMVDVAVNPANADDVYCIDTVGWGGKFLSSHDGGKSWATVGDMRSDHDADPTGKAQTHGGMSALTNLTLSPVNPKLLFISSNWRPTLSKDSGATWTESDRGADISVVYDIRFSGKRTYASAMDEGVFSTEDGGTHWTQLWPLNGDDNINGDYWRMAVWDNAGVDRILSTCTPWNRKKTNRVVYSDDSGKTFKSSTAGLPNYNIHANTMWGLGYMRALALDPKDPKIVYAGIDGDVADGNQGGGVFKSTDGGDTWVQLPNQPASRRMFFGLVVDPTDSQRLYWGCCGTNGGVYRSEDGGDSWKQIFAKESFIMNLAISPNGTLYVPGKNLWKTTDHGETWTQISDFKDGLQILGLETSPTDEKTIWISEVDWSEDTNGHVRKTTDGGMTWIDITGDIPYRKPIVLRFNPIANELWAGGVGLWKLRQ